MARRFSLYHTNNKLKTSMVAICAAVVVLGAGYTILRSFADTPTNCTVTDKLVNPCRPWLGAAANRYDTTSDYAAQVRAHEQLIGKQVDFEHTYYGLGNRDITNQTINSTDRAMYNRTGTYLFVNWKPVRHWRDANSTNTAVNQAVDAMADSIKNLGSKKILLTLNHEAENDITGGVDGCTNFSPANKAEGGTPAEFRNMWAYVENRFQSRGVTNVVWSMDYMNVEKWDCVVDDLWPGNNLVDWVLFNAYAYGDMTASSRITRFQGIMNSYQSSTRDFRSKPWGIAEWNVHNMRATKAYQYYDDMKTIAEGGVSGINLKAFFVFDSIGPDGNNNRVQDVWTGEGSGHDAKYTKDTAKITHYKDFAASDAFKDGANNGGGNPPPSNTDTTAPSVPTNVTSTSRTSNSISLSWTASTDNVGVTGYRVYVNGTQVGSTAETLYTATNLQANTAYTITVAAYDAANNSSAQSPSVSVTTLAATDTTAPSVPTNVTATAVSGTEVDLTWSASTDNVGVASYIIQRDGTTVGQINSGATSYHDTTVLPLTTYSYVIKAVDTSNNTSAGSAAKSVTTPVVADTTAPTMPTRVTAVFTTNTYVQLDWHSSTDNVGVKDYLIYRDGTLIAHSRSSNYGDATVRRGTRPRYRIAARDAAGNVSTKSPAVQPSQHR